jgi:two-component system nitrate/nitrite response regulator NarL
MSTPSKTTSTPSKATTELRVFVADRNRMSSQLLADSLSKIACFKVSSVAPASDIVSISKNGKADVAVVSGELESGPTHGIQLARLVRDSNPSISIVILLELCGLKREPVIACFRNGARGVFCREDPFPDLCHCIRLVSEGQIWARGVVADYLLEAVATIPSLDALEQLGKLSRQEMKAAVLAAQGFTNKQIANQLGLSEHTIKNYLFHSFEKLRVSNRIELLFLLVNGRTYRDEGAGGLPYPETGAAEQSDHDTYWRLRMAELTSSRIIESTRSSLLELRKRLSMEEIQELEKLISQKLEDQVDFMQVAPKQVPGESHHRRKLAG